MATSKSSPADNEKAKGRKAPSEAKAKREAKPKAGKQDKAGKSGNAERASKPSKAVKESFRFPAEDHALFARLKARAKLAGRPAKKGELVRAGLRLLISLDEAVLVEQLRQLDAKRRD